MALYLATGIIERGLDYTNVVTKYPQYKTQIDQILIDKGFEEKIV